MKVEVILRKKGTMKDPLINQKAAGQRRERCDSLENREHILTVARGLFTAQGVAETSMNEIAHVAHVGSGTLYRHFANKGKLCEALLEKEIAAFWARIDAPLGPEVATSPLSQLERFLDELLGLTESHMPLLAAIDEAKNQQEQYYRDNPFFHQLHKRVVHLLSKAMVQGEIVKLNETFTANVILGAIAPPLYASHRQYWGLSCEQIVVEMRRLFIDGLRVRPVDGRGEPDPSFVNASGSRA